MTKQEALYLIQRVAYRFSKEPERQRFVMTFDKVDGVDTPFHVLIDRERGVLTGSGAFLTPDAEDG